MSDGVVALIPKRDLFALIGALTHLEREVSSLRYACTQYTGEDYQITEIDARIVKLKKAWADTREEVDRR